MFRGFLIIAVLLTTACSPGALLPGQKDPPRLFELTPKSTFDLTLPSVPWQLLVETPVAAAGIDTSRIALKNSPTTLDYFAASEWSDRAPAMIQTLLIESFENSERIVSVGRESLALRSDYSLKVELREFQAEYFENAGDAPAVHVRINLKLVKMPERLIVAGNTFSTRLQSSSNTLDDIVDAFDEALGKVLKRLVSWTLTTGAASEAPSS